MRASGAERAADDRKERGSMFARAPFLRFARQIGRQKVLHIMILPVIVWLIVFHYVPIFGMQIAFKDYMFKQGILGSAWVGLKHMRAIFTDPMMGGIILNTLGMSAIKVFFAFPVPIILALALNELVFAKARRVFQTVSYFPHFISWTVVALMATVWFSPSTGFVNDLLLSAGILKEPYLFLGEPKAFWWVSMGLDIWKSSGWVSIIYLSAIAGISPEMYEAATIDGASRFQRMIGLTLPCLLPTITIMAIMNIGNMLNGGLNASNFQISYLLGNTLNNPSSEILDTYVLKVGVSLGRFSYATAVGLLKGAVSMLLLLGANSGAKKLTGENFF
jgi:putative aldouronate transport system permease protein